ncbi:MAG TPA: hypothetical protein DEA55_04480 [Rhodospirillaceae bacterium]|nr:hypothetical protein [Rhodospirillaceae bacterium]
MQQVWKAAVVLTGMLALGGCAESRTSSITSENELKDSDLEEILSSISLNSREIIHLDITACSGDDVPVSLFTDLEVTIRGSDTENLDRHREDLLAETKRLYENLTLPAKELLRRTNSSTNSTSSKTPLINEIKGINLRGALLAANIAFSNKGIVLAKAEVLDISIGFGGNSDPEQTVCMSPDSNI